MHWRRNLLRCRLHPASAWCRFNVSRPSPCSTRTGKGCTTATTSSRWWKGGCKRWCSQPPPPTPPLHHPTHARTQQPYPLLCPLPIAAPDTYTHSTVYTGWNCSGLGAVVQPAVLGVPAARGVRHTASIRCHRHRTTHMSSGESYRNSCICHVSSPSVPRQEFSLLSLL